MNVQDLESKCSDRAIVMIRERLIREIRSAPLRKPPPDGEDWLRTIGLKASSFKPILLYIVNQAILCRRLMVLERFNKQKVMITREVQTDPTGILLIIGSEVATQTDEIESAQSVTDEGARHPTGEAQRINMNAIIETKPETSYKRIKLQFESFDASNLQNVVSTVFKNT
jgi:hypothetical protein